MTARFILAATSCAVIACCLAAAIWQAAHP